ncbi:VQ motif-containing protein 20-like [Juglans microcarpa x Juglans regia]|uniref:VQ motif-containing protein 20-like n=1 Tax=Juglans microcarpa x Juglans regia TaxID=2249226 RepID=UPI001B7EA209|nr:VQ motif-containing protein 20-like [Juglans microcarpa x Juglans regia]
MSLMQFLAKTENGLCSSPLIKWNKDSRLIKKSSSESLSSSASSLITSRPQQHQRHGPVIIYTHSPKIIQTHPKDFMSLVQKLSDLSHPKEEGFVRHGHESSDMTTLSNGEDNKNTNMIQLGNDDTESSSVITDENCTNVNNINVDQVNSCFACVANL